MKIEYKATGYKKSGVFPFDIKWTDDGAEMNEMLETKCDILIDDKVMGKLGASLHCNGVSIDDGLPVFEHFTLWVKFYMRNDRNRFDRVAYDQMDCGSIEACQSMTTRSFEKFAEEVFRNVNGYQ